MHSESEALSLKLEGMSALQRKLLIELIQRKHPQFWSRFTSQKYGWQSQKESLEEFIQTHPSEFAIELSRYGLNNGWRARRG